MITSEVQRTLVKSPPELWAELSDPAFLARHLGELGEIRITRVDPEERVEWEATGASGSVAIKPSGWGTRVTLTVQHDAPAHEQAAPSTPEPASWSPPVEAAAAPEDPEATPVEAATALRESEPSPIDAATAPEDAPDEWAEVGAGPNAFAEPEPGDIAVPESESMDVAAPQTEPEPGPAGIAVPQTEPEPEPEAVDADMPEPVTALARWAAAVDAERGGPNEPVPEAEFESETAPVAIGPHLRDPREAPAEQELPRRGFFARLFRRRRRPAVSETSLPAAAGSPELDELPTDVVTSALGVSGREEPPVLEHLHEASSPEGEAVTPLAPAPPEDEGAEGANVFAPGGEDHRAEAPDAHALDANTDAEASILDVDSDPDAHADADGHAEAFANAAAEATQQEPQPDESGAGGEHAAQRGTEEVTALLTAVLDRLGAAHHRPFSRG